jgi:hypothetical protein
MAMLYHLANKSYGWAALGAAFVIVNLLWCWVVTA